jgi:LPXTG-motif cell wall-anchored protein
MHKHATTRRFAPTIDNRTLSRSLTVAAVTVALVFAPALFAGPAAFGAEPSVSDPSVVEPSGTAAEPAPAEPAPAEPAPVETAPIGAPLPTEAAPEAAAAAVAPGDITLFAVLPFSVTSPVEGTVTNDFANLVFFDGTGTTGNTVTVTYLNAAGVTTTAGVGTVDADGFFTVLTNFSELQGGQTNVIATVTETDEFGAISGGPVEISFSFLNPPVEAFPFTVTSPAQGETVFTTTPIFTGTGTPGDTIVIAYTNVNLEDAIAGETVVAADGTFSVATTFLGLAPGAVEVRTFSTGFSPAGVELVTGRIATLFFFNIAPVFLPGAASITIIPGSLTVSDVTNINRGVQLSATGFERNEALTTTVTGPNGAAVTLSATAAGNADVNGSITDVLVLSGTITPGQYTVTVLGAISGLEQSAVFTVVADPIVAPVTPVVTVIPADAGVVALNPTGTPNTSLAQTGTNQSTLMGLSTIAALFTLAGGAILVLRRKNATRVTTDMKN